MMKQAFFFLFSFRMKKVGLLKGDLFLGAFVGAPIRRNDVGAMRITYRTRSRYV
jgi:hypothetical protein